MEDIIKAVHPAKKTDNRGDFNDLLIRLVLPQFSKQPIINMIGNGGSRLGKAEGHPFGLGEK